ncbi:hypothetical protein [Clostridioides sp. ZZV14-6153]|uniref:hypothetical protein n=1 Tax=Clostridioides sp. ZZV14-6153 TaxID=2811494 RepID=UPI001D1196CB|nr:hypothetical protein [Clostridioides sp. ZZV14-6153]
MDYVLDLYSEKTEYFKEKNLVKISRIFLIDKSIILSKVIKRALIYLSCEPWKYFRTWKAWYQLRMVKNGIDE